MSVPIDKTAIINPYQGSIESCRECLEVCRQFLDHADRQGTCITELRTLVSTLGQAIRLMEKKSRFTPRYLVDCAEICAMCARRCEESPQESYKYAAKACRKGVVVCRRASLI